jgi:hypothetical protein
LIIARLVRGDAPITDLTIAEETPIGRPGQPNEGPPALLFHACDGSSYLSGPVLHPNGSTIVNG